MGQMGIEFGVIDFGIACWAGEKCFGSSFNFLLVAQHLFFNFYQSGCRMWLFLHGGTGEMVVVQGCQCWRHLLVLKELTGKGF